jgi:acyl-CoA thioester hydrolase
MQMPYEFTLSHRVEFAETDMAGIVHFANFYRMMENTEHAFFRSLGFSVHGYFDGVPIGWPRVSATCDFFKPLRFEETVDIQLIVAELRNRSIRYAFRFWKDDAGQRVEVARGQVATVCASVDRATGKLAAVPIPAAISAVIQAAPPEILAEIFPAKQAAGRS